MARTKEQLIDAYFLPHGFIIDDVFEPNEQTKIWKEAFDKNKYEALFHLGFLNKDKWFSPSVEYLHHITEILIKKLSQKPEIELLRMRWRSN